MDKTLISRFPPLEQLIFYNKTDESQDDA
eukprot:COSAG02_NODE_47223_length_342_cov_2.246914_1_plen_28_part_10